MYPTDRPRARRSALAAATALGIAATALLAAPGLDAALGTGTAAQAAAGGSIVFVKNYNVWIARGDGTGQRAVTAGGSFASPWVSPSQSDSGLVVVVRGNLIYEMDQWGRVKRKLDPPPLKNSAGQMMDGPLVGAVVSPDGKRIAYTYTKETCPIGASCFTRSVTGYTDAAQLTPPQKYGSTFFDSPSWVTNTRTLQSGGYHSQMNLHDLGSAQASYWFDDEQIYGDENGTDLGNAEISRDGKLLAAVRGYGDDQQIIWYRVVGDARTGKPGLPEPMCWTEKGAGITNPSWSPDGTAIAIEQPEGIEIGRNVAGCSNITMAFRGGSEPSWSNAPLSTSRPAATHFVLKKKPRISGTAKVGRTLRVSRGSWSPAPSSVKYRWTRDGKRIAGATKASYRVTKKDRRHRIAAIVTVKRTGVGTASAKAASKRVR